MPRPTTLEDPANSRSLTLRLPSDLLGRIDAIAEENFEDRSTVIRRLMRLALDDVNAKAWRFTVEKKTE